MLLIGWFLFRSLFGKGIEVQTVGINSVFKVLK